MVDYNQDRQRMVADALWQTIVLAYTPPGDRSGKLPPLPVREVAGALLTCLANLIAQIGDRSTRRNLMSQIGPLVQRGVTDATSRESGLIPGSGIILPD